MNHKILKNERIFVAGAKGMAGSAICRSLLKKGYGLSENDGNLLTPSRNDLNCPPPIISGQLNGYPIMPSSSMCGINFFKSIQS